MFVNPPPLLNITSKELAEKKARELIIELKKTITNPTQYISLINKWSPYSRLLNQLVLLGNRVQIKTRFQKATLRTLGRSDRLFEKKETVKQHLFLPKTPELWLEKTFTLPLHFSIDKAKIIGFKPTISFEEGKKKIRKWLFNSYSPSENRVNNYISIENPIAVGPIVNC